ncbi:hypothetical protein WKW77_11710 [Variovorax ureilyticus]|uniref:Uncharacterized protein n=1 Tax=Variovorax ureilyticus TaxID=1836198 RepID=A0ABU8VDS2_9BURK
MPSMKVLLSATYPLVEPRHGGQLRTRHIYEIYKKAGIDVDYVGIFPEGAYTQRADTDLQLPGELGGRTLQEHEQALYDYVWGMHIANNELARCSLLKRIRAGRYDYIQIDLLYVWPLVRECLSQLGPDEPRPRIIYSSQNIEHEMKRQILQELGAPAGTVEQYGKEVFELERDIARKASHVFAVSESDRNTLNVISDRNDCVLAKNGTSYSTVSERATEDWRPVLPSDPFAVFISSGHLPNAVGFSTVMGQSMAFLPPDRKLVIAGGVTEVIERTKAYRRWSGINNARTLRLGIVDDIGIAAMRRFAHVFILPITAGGGSNIKTAEALLTGAHVLGTPTAFRGYEEYIDEPSVYVEADPVRFRARLVELLHSGRAKLSDADLVARKRLLWESALSAMPAQLFKESSLHAHGTTDLV